MRRVNTGCSLLLTLSGFLVACSSGGSSSGDCNVTIRAADTTYTSVTVTEERPSTVFGPATMSPCLDVGLESRGVASGAEWDEVEAWQFKEFDSDAVLSVRLADSWQVFIANSVGKSERDRIVRSLSE